MTDRKKRGSRNQAALKTRSGEAEKIVKAPAKEELREEPVKNARTQTKEEQRATASKAPARRERRASRQETRSGTRREAKGLSALGDRFRKTRIGRFVYDAYTELRYKVTWPNPKDARKMTIAVVGLSAVVGGIIALADFGLQQLFLLIIGGN